LISIFPFFTENLWLIWDALLSASTHSHAADPGLRLRANRMAGRVGASKEVGHFRVAGKRA
jgi:hypothetical protein